MTPAEATDEQIAAAAKEAAHVMPPLTDEQVARVVALLAEVKDR